MTIANSPPLVSLQAPKDVSIEEVESQLQSIWHSYTGEEGPAATRATTFSFVVCEPDDTQPLLAALGYYTGPIDGIAGPRTAAAIKAAQKAYGLEITGKADSQLRDRLHQVFAEAKELGQLKTAETVLVEQYSPDIGGAHIADAIAASNPCRIITLCPTLGEDEGVSAQVSAYCPIQKQNQNTLVCCEYITLQGTAIALERNIGVISALVVSDLPQYLWWKATPEPDYSLFQRLASTSDVIIFDSSIFVEPETNLRQLSELLDKNMPIADLNWGRLAAWQELTAEAFDPPERRNAILEVDRVTIDYEQSNVAQALLYLGWLASRLQWRPVAYEQEGGDYDIRRVKFTNADQRSIEAELAGIPTAESRDRLGNLTSLRLSSTNLAADCCTVLCSETTGCMRMEAGGGAQSCRIQQVTPLMSQSTENLLGQQLQRGAKDALYEESLRVVGQILQLA